MGTPAPISHCLAGYSVEMVDLHAGAVTIFEAIQLVRLGARASLVCEVTGLEKAVLKRLYRQLHGRPSPSGQTPFTDTWYLENQLRMLQATVVWRLFRHYNQTGRSTARILIDVYESYTHLVEEPLLDLTRAAFVPRLITMKLWHESHCKLCNEDYVTPLSDIEHLCPGCKLYKRSHRCD